MMVRLWPNLAAAPMRTGGSYRGKTGHASLWWARRFMTDSVEKGFWFNPCVPY
jgi:hypothetical protein